MVVTETVWHVHRAAAVGVSKYLTPTMQINTPQQLMLRYLVFAVPCALSWVAGGQQHKLLIHCPVACDQNNNNNNHQQLTERKTVSV